MQENTTQETVVNTVEVDNTKQAAETKKTELDKMIRYKTFCKS